MGRLQPLAQNSEWDYTITMTTKDHAIKVIQELPEDATWDDIQERINFMAGVRKGLRELDEGEWNSAQCS